MRLKNLFTVPTGQKVTEKALRRVLISSICSILLCMTCLVSTTWAWFTVSIENAGNEIQIANVTLDVTFEPKTEDALARSGEGYVLESGSYNLKIKITNEADENNDRAGAISPVYVVMTTDDGKSWCWKFSGNLREANSDLEIGINQTKVGFSVSWIEPDGATMVENDPIVIGESQTETVSDQETTPTTEPPTTAPTTEPSTQSTTSPEI